MTVIDVSQGMTGAVRPMYEERLGEKQIMNLEQPCIHISVRNLVEFILRHGDIDNRTGGGR